MDITIKHFCPRDRVRRQANYDTNIAKERVKRALGSSKFN